MRTKLVSTIAKRADRRVTRRHRERMRLARETFGTPAFDRLVQLYDEAEALRVKLWDIVGPDPMLAMIRSAPDPTDDDDERWPE